MTTQGPQESGFLANRYRVLHKLGEGAMGLVWQVEDTTNGKIMALKQIAGKFGVDDVSVLKFRQEFRLMRQVRHPHCCSVYDFGQLATGAPFYTMELVAGLGIDELGVVPEAGVRHILGQLLLALAYLHQMKLVHRDIKSQNVKVIPGERGPIYGTVKLMDFGLMEFAGRSDLPISGTIGYIAPEIAKRGLIDQRADLYALGCLVYEMLTGTLPFVRSSHLEMVKAHVTEPPPRPSLVCRNLTPELENVVMRLLAKEPHDRFQSAGEVLDALGMERPGGYGGTLLASPMVGRELELMRLFDGLGSIMGGDPAMHFHITGPVGMGKTRLVHEFRTVMQLENVPFFICQCREVNAAPLAPLRELFQSMVPASRAVLDHESKLRIAALGTLAPELITLEDAHPIPNQDRVSVIEGAQVLLELLAVQQPLIVLCEDWHLIDDISRDIFEGIFKACEHLPILWITTARELEAETPCLTVEHLHLPLHRLTEADIAKMVQFALGETQVDERFVAQVLSLSDGLPFYIERLLEHLVQEGLLTRVNGRWDTQACAFAAGMPRDVQGLVAKKLVALNEDAITLARLASVSGGSMDLELLKSLTSFGENRLFDALNQLQAQKVFIQSAQGEYEFTQALFRQVCYESFSITERQRTHGKVADLLAERLRHLSPSQPEFEMTCAVADHYILACMPDQIIKYALAAGKLSITVFALDVAIRYLGSVHALLQAPRDAAQLSHKAECLSEVGRVHKLKGDIHRALDCFKDALAVAVQAGENERILRIRATLAEVSLEGGLFDDARTQCEAMLNLINARQQPALYARCLLMRASVSQAQGRVQRAKEDVEEALKIARAIHDTAMMAESLTMSGHLRVTTLPRQVSQGIQELTEAVELLGKLGHHQALMTSQNFLGFALYRCGRYREALAAFAQSCALSEQLNQGEDTLTALLNQSLALIELGQVEDSVTLSIKAGQLASRSGIELMQGLAAAFSALGLAWCGRLREADVAARTAKAVQSNCADRVILALLMEFRMEYLNLIGHFEETRRLGLALLLHLKEAGNVEPESHVRVLLGIAAARMGDDDEARHLLKVAMADKGADHVYLKALTTSVWLQVRRGQYDAAAQDLVPALHLARQCHANRTLVELYGLKGEIELNVGATDATTTFSEMAALADTMAIPALRAQAQFGSAAAKPYDACASQLVLDAQACIKAQVEGLDASLASAYLAPVERARIVAGNHIALSLQRTEKKGPQTGPLRGIGFSSGQW